MEQNPLEQGIDRKINLIREELKNNLDVIFDNKETELNIKIEDFIAKLEFYKKNGLEFNKEEIVNGLRESINIKNKEAFVSFLLKLLNPIIIARATHPDIFKKFEIENEILNRENIINEDGNIRLSEVLYCGFGKKDAHIHLAPAYDYMTREKIGEFDIEIKNGLRNLAKMIKPMKNIERIVATSWIVAKSPKRLEKLGFTIEGEISEDERNKHFKDSIEVIHKAYIERKKFDELYLN